MRINFGKTIKYSRLAFRKIKNNFQSWFFIKTGFFLPVPREVYYTVNNKCNFRCQMCSHWKMGMEESNDDYLSESRVIELIDEMDRLGIRELGFSGGEPLIFKDKLIRFLSYANGKGIYTHFVTNGSLLTKEIVEKYDNVGGGHISISVDALSETHNELRGVEFAYEGITKALKIFEENKFNNIVLKINTVISDRNLDEIIPIIKYTEKIGAMIFIQPYDVYDFDNKYKIKEREVLFPLWVKRKNYSKLKKILDEISEIKRKNPALILNDEKHINDIYPYYTEGLRKDSCYASIDHLFVNAQGKISFCKFGVLADLKKENLTEFLGSKKWKKVVKDSLNCKVGCMLGCMYRPTLLDLIKNGPRQFLRLISN